VPLTNAGAVHFSNAGRSPPKRASPPIYLAASDTITIPASATVTTIHGAGTTDTIVLPGNAGDYTITDSADSSYVILQNSLTGVKTTVDLYGDSTLQFADSSLATTNPAYSFMAAQNLARQDISFGFLFHYGTANQTTDNVIGEQSASLGSGYSAVVLSGARSAYGVSVDSNGTLTLSDTASGKSYTITGDHYLIFDGGAAGSNAGFQDLDYVLQGSDAQVASIYNAALGRLPDLAGLEFYGHAFAAGTLDLHQTGVYFLASPEFQSRFAAAALPADNGGPNDQAFITQLYQNVLHRTPSAAETAFYVSDLQGTLVGVAQQDRAQLLVNFALSPENQKDISGWLI